MPLCHPTLPYFWPHEPAARSTSISFVGERAMLSRLIEPPNDAEPMVDVPTPRWIWMVWRLRARWGKSAKYVDMSWESASGTPSSVKLRRVDETPLSVMYE